MEANVQARSRELLHGNLQCFQLPKRGTERPTEPACVSSMPEIETKWNWLDAHTPSRRANPRM
jgi:hypothetical protein